MFRVYGHSDEKIERMPERVPMCLKSHEAYDKLRKALKKLSKEIAYEMGGNKLDLFSQEALYLVSAESTEGVPRSSADGINVSVATCHSEGDEFMEPKYTFPTTVNEILGGMRFSCKKVAEFCKTGSKCYDEWSEILPVGLQFTFCEDDTDIPLWEARINIRDL